MDSGWCKYGLRISLYVAVDQMVNSDLTAKAVEANRILREINQLKNSSAQRVSVDVALDMASASTAAKPAGKSTRSHHSASFSSSQQTLRE